MKVQKISLADAIVALKDAVVDFKINFSIDSDNIDVYWCGVIHLRTQIAADAATAIKLFKHLESLGAEDC